MPIASARAPLRSAICSSAFGSSAPVLDRIHTAKTHLKPDGLLTPASAGQNLTIHRLMTANGNGTQPSIFRHYLLDVSRVFRRNFSITNEQHTFGVAHRVV